jgi:hypothetical protein
LTFAVHIEERCLTVKKKIAELRHFSKTTWGKNNKRALLHLYKAIIDPMLLYAVPIWVDARDPNRLTFNRLQTGWAGLKVPTDPNG